MKPAESWSSHPVYARYWQHYYQAMAWMRSHQNAYRKAVEFYVSSPWYFGPPAFPLGSYAEDGQPPQSLYDHPSAFQHAPCGYSQAPPCGQHPQGSAEDDQAWAADEMESESDDEVECDLSNMEITEELRQYFAETERHREERRRQQQLDEARLQDYVNADHDLYYNTHRSVEAPSERPGERRQAEMKRLYGEGAAKILAMEAAVQLSFDKYFDRKRPKYWPVIPLKF